MGKMVFLKIQKNIYNFKLKIAYLASVFCFFVSGTVSGSIKRDLGGFWFLFFSLYIFFTKGWAPRPSCRTDSPKGKGHKVFDRLEIPRRSRTIPPLLIRLLHLNRLYTEKELRAAKLCKHLLRKPSNSAFIRWKTKLKTVGRTLSDPRLVNEHSGDQS